ncbi:helix-turn-helix domain-containing protein [Sphaerisporangium album]|nr:helix-turn-helix transcriptional regulator [Sphaerisporangium album]
MAPPTRLSLPFDGLRARRERERQGLTLVALADRCAEAGRRFAHTTISRWESGDFGPTAPSVKVLADALGVTVDDLCTPADEDNSNTTPASADDNDGRPS